jgi:hypothetical protein
MNTPTEIHRARAIRARFDALRAQTVEQEAELASLRNALRAEPEPPAAEASGRTSVRSAQPSPTWALRA